MLFTGIFLFILPKEILAQQKITGKIIDRETGEPIPFANIVFDIDNKQGTTADLSGNFSIETKNTTQSMKISHISYETRFYSLAEETENIIISLQPRSRQLDEVFIIAEKNPAEAIIRKVIANRDRNNPEKVRSFTFRSYNKISFDFLPHRRKDTSKVDSAYIRLSTLAKKMNVMLMESVSERKFIYPNHDEETIIGTKVSGLQNPPFAALATDFQPFSFYEDILTVLDRNFVNPISKGSLSKYEYKLRDTIFQATDTIYMIEFQPKKNRIFDAMKGMLYINTHHYAVQNVIAEPYEVGLMSMKIEQKYTCINRQQWFPEQLNFEIMAERYPSKEIGIKVQGQSYIKQVDLDPKITKKDFGMVNVRMTKDAGQKDSLFWQTERQDSLTQREITTYIVLDSIGEKNKFDQISQLTESLSRGRIGIGILDLDVNNLFVFNEVEGSRVGLGLITNDKLSRRFSIGGYGAYGFRDKRWKYGGEFNLNLNYDREIQLSLIYRNDVNEPGQSYFDSERGFTNFRSYLTSLMDRITLKQAVLRGRPFKFTTMEIGLSDYQRQITYDYQFRPDNGTEYNFTDLGVKVRFAYGEQLVESMGQRIAMPSRYPVLSVGYIRGLNGFMGGEFNYQKIEAEISQNIATRSWGNISFKLRGGMIDGQLPITNLFFGAGGFDSSLTVYIPQFFQTVRPYEFLSDRYVNLFYEQSFPAITMPVKFSRPKLSLIHAMGYGTLQNPEDHQGIPFKTLEKGLFESGIIIDQLVRINYVNIAYLGVGAGVFYRYGPNSLTNQRDNLAFKISITFSTN
jgi:hypothetical protein